MPVRTEPARLAVAAGPSVVAGKAPSQTAGHGTGTGTRAQEDPDGLVVRRRRLAETADIASAWRDLARRALEPNVFLGPDVLPPRLAAFAPQAELVTVEAPDGRLVLLAAVSRRRIGFGLTGRLTALWSDDYAPLGTPLVAPDGPGGAEAAWMALLSHLSDRTGRRLGAFALPDQRLDGPVHAAFVEAARSLGLAWAGHGMHERAALAGGRSPEAHRLAAIEPRRRKEYARQGRRLAEQGHLVGDTVTNPDEIPAAFVEYLTLEAAGWKGRNGTALRQEPAARGFMETAVAALGRSGALTIDRLRLDGRPVALLLRVRDGGTAWPWKIAYDEAHAAMSPGVQIMLQSTARLLDDPGFRLADSLAVAGHPMIEHLWRERIRIGTLIVGPAGRGNFGVSLKGFEFELHDRTRALARGLRDALRTRFGSRRKPARTGRTP
ncbi:GNAT family N-acetyltransferase [Prosthecodimorpha staleyi]|uniref:GNAT family N-acetyltransferase n=1 Tax=Prosthecodimorpha staleyi TaxID=2840188 RepID=A0A947DBD3_9HYPH|nr:GNAT family N-acetyltransferase [Prosthecodimorpha staleyi]MBT9291119.1 GNAT family N-acetyltransferase [Prosthecodimorpha staleyi]